MSVPSNLQPILFLVVIAAVFYLLMIRPQQKKRKETQSMLQSLKPGSEIVTTAGMYGKIVAIDADDSLLVEVAPGVTCKYMKQAVMRVVPEVGAGASTTESLPEPSKDGEPEETAKDEAAADTDGKLDADSDAAVDAKSDDAETPDEADAADKDRRSSS
ncbi:MAG: preprotein translocase subunit YajC [Streptosporangiales bacterium]|nr:preprotein translocase subunit YajC [Streptosporangiales bacterium]